MKRLVLSILGIAFLCGSVAFAVNPSDTPKDKVLPAKIAPSKPTTTTAKPKPIPRETRMRATGIIKEMTADLLRIERTVTSELMEFYLEKPLDKINVGDKVTISYVKKEEKNMAIKVSKAMPKKRVASPPTSGPVPQPSPPPAK